MEVGRIKNSILLIIFIWLLLYQSLSAQSNVPLDSIKYKRRQIFLYTAAPIVYVSSMTGLYYLWYKDYPSYGFRFFNDNTEWLQMDKVGHLYTAYSFGNLGMNSMRWAGIKNKKAIWYGGLSGLAFLTTIEVFDGFSAGWGFSWGDMTANTLGSSLLIGQELLWKEQRIKIKFCFHPTQYSKYNPNLLGKNIIENVIKDYNGQTYWASINLASFMNKPTRFPNWLNVALGYGADGMTGAKENPEEIKGMNIPYFQRHRQFYISTDIDLSKIKTKSRLLKTVLSTATIKIPMPTFMITDAGRAKFYWLYF